MVPTTPLVAALFASIAVGAAAGILAWRERPKPGATPLVALLVGQTWWSTCLFFRVQAQTLHTKRLWMDLVWVGVVLVPVAWGLFALEYTGRDRFVRARYVALLCAVPAVTELLVVLEPSGALFHVAYGAASNGIVEFEYSGLWYVVIAGYTYLVGLGGAAAILELVTSDAVAFRGQGVALLVGLAAPWATNVAYVAGFLQTPGIDPTPIAFAVSGVAYLWAITRFRLLGTNPAARRRARELVFDGMHEGALVVDGDDNVIDANDYAVGVLDTSARDLLGASARDAVPGYESFPESGSLPGHLELDGPEGTRAYDVGVTTVTNVRGTRIGRVVTLHDSSAHVRHQQRLAVLHRVLRHNIRTETNVIHGYADGLDDDAARIVRERAVRIDELGRKGRQAIELLDSGDDDGTVAVRTLLRDAAADARDAAPDAVVECDPPAGDAAVSRTLRPVLANLVENAIAHNPADRPRVSLAARVEGERVVLTVTDDGPGIDDVELRVLDTGVETPLEHGSGLGLWIVTWGVDAVGGTVRFDENDPAGTVVTLDVPVGDAPGE